jgi:hypothetical protein
MIGGKSPKPPAQGLIGVMSFLKLVPFSLSSSGSGRRGIYIESATADFVFVAAIFNRLVFLQQV